MPHRVIITGLSGCSGGALFGLVELLATANTITGNLSSAPQPFEVRLGAISGDAIEVAGGIPVPARQFRVIEDDTVLVAGAQYADENAVRRGLETVSEDLPRLMKLVSGSGRFGSHCGGVFQLAEAGLLQGHTVTTAWWLAPLFSKRYPDVALQGDAMVVNDGPCLTAAGSSAWQDMGLHLVEEVAGSHIARLVAKYLLLDNQRDSQAPYAIRAARHQGDDLVLRAEDWIRHNIQRDFRLEELAQALGISQRTLIRRFQAGVGESPLSAVQRLRMEKSKMLLETTRLNLADIIVRCGYTDESAFRRQFRKHCGLSPREYRRRFNTAGRAASRPGDHARPC